MAGTTGRGLFRQYRKIWARCTRWTQDTPASGMYRIAGALKLQMAALPGRLRLTNKLHCKKYRWRRSNPEGKFKERWFHEDFGNGKEQGIAMGRRRGGHNTGGSRDIRTGLPGGEKSEPAGEGNGAGGV